MISAVKSYLNDFAHLIYPHHCEGCGSDVLQNSQLLCSECLLQLPETGFAPIQENTVEKRFYGRLPIYSATAAFYFTKESLIQHLMHQLKYKGNKDVGIYLGKLLGHQLKQSNRFNEVEVLIPLPLNPKREFKRGYNQAMLICEGIAEVVQKPIANNAVVRTVFTETQTKNDRIHRWENMDGVFEVADEIEIKDKHVLLIDDIITTGATLEACGKVILEHHPKALSIASVAYAS
jgi:ComF family protein